jgi:hypothetical protein
VLLYYGNAEACPHITNAAFAQAGLRTAQSAHSIDVFHRHLLARGLKGPPFASQESEFCHYYISLDCYSNLRVLTQNTKMPICRDVFYVVL